MGSGTGEECVKLCSKHYGVKKEQLNILNQCKINLDEVQKEIIDNKYKKVSIHLPPNSVFIFTSKNKQDHCVVVESVKTQLYLNKKYDLVCLDNKKEILITKRGNLRTKETKNVNTQEQPT